jgi:hypothetical protein
MELFPITGVTVMEIEALVLAAQGFETTILLKYIFITMY